MSAFGAASLGVVCAAPVTTDLQAATPAAAPESEMEPTTMAKPRKSPTEQVLDAIATAGGEISGADLRDQLDLDDTERKAAITALRRAGKIESEGSTVAIVYRLTGGDGRSLRPAKQPAPAPADAPATEPAADATVAPASGAQAAATDPTAALQASAARAQEALDAYIQSACNAAVLGALLEARDRSRQALEAYTAVRRQ
jgi:hypothetical protein